MTEIIEQLHVGINIGTAGLVLALLGLAVLYYAYDKQKARYIHYQGIMRAFVEKATADRNDKARIPADLLVNMFELNETRAIKYWNPRTYKFPRHPALQPANRGKG